MERHHERLEIRPGPAEYEARLRQGNLVPVSAEIVADLDTPISAFLKIRDLPRAFLLESVEGGERLGRYTFLGGAPRDVLVYDRTRDDNGGFLARARARMAPFRPVPDPDLPRFVGGLLGYLGYDLVRDWEQLPSPPRDDVGAPTCELGLYDTVLAFDHVRRRIRIIANAFADEGAEVAYRVAQSRVEELYERLRRPLPEQSRPAAMTNVDLSSNFSEEAFQAMVTRGKRYIRAGDVFQVVLSQRFSADIGDTDPFLIYRAARAVNPSPFLFYLDFDHARVVGASPELLVRLESGEVMMRPIAGTRPRGTTAEEDREMERSLLADEKERAEHVMLVDLTRNDLGRISLYGSVRTSDLMTIERYSHVMHMVSTVRGALQPNRDAFDVLRAVFPHGTVSGAPKVRAMEIIDELEPAGRHLYAGAAGYVGFNGAMDTAITIRTLVIRDGRAYVQAGAGIVADSDPAAEHRECWNKAQALIRAIGLARSGAIG
ncbi:MAG: anthranilate synthase component I [Armatimonadetes bacterium]|nr:anthranilate synthase component I [Armatimonadota bacterium]